METTARSTHPLVIVAAIAVTLFSLIGIATMTGLVPSSKGNQEHGAQQAAVAPAAPVVAPSPASSEAPARDIAATPAPAHKPLPTHAQPSHKPVVVAQAKTETHPDVPASPTVNPPAGTPGYPPAGSPAAPPVRVSAAPVCNECGVVESVREIQKAGEGSGLGAVAGGVLGGVLGHQVGGGRGKDVMTVAGAVGGAIAGHQIEKNVKKTSSYEITLRMDNGSTQTVSQPSPPPFRAGDKVKLIGGAIQAGN